ncbi:hypothetical protein GCM10010174_61980 [Kutzneria viridogrisea]|uniref:Uncharacterized protein n=1 Tax=Kutzneria viridogrisea TaxID=47990 RepID=A0ABR6BG72_9PSEU|nr:hypothetical protein [Kutzneria viridogrisea]
MLATLVIVFLGLGNVGLFWFALRAMRRAARTADQILAEELGHRGAHARYDRELAEWRRSLGQ